MVSPIARYVLGLIAGLMWIGTTGRAAIAADGLQIHEWGTFTALQNEKGDALPGINIDDEPLPAFCHNLHPWALEPSRTLPTLMMKGAPERHPYVTLRLETPVLYFHPAPGEKLPFTVNVDVQFHGGWLTEFYPHAAPDAPGLGRSQFNFGPITANTIGSLAWHDVQVGGADPEPAATSEHVWLAPRNVLAAMVTVPPQTDKDEQPESERFLFYRGVANRPVPLRVSEDQAAREFSIRGQCADVLQAGQSMQISGVWLVHILKDGRVAYRTLDPITVSSDTTTVLARTRSGFAENEYSTGRLDELRTKVHQALVADGLNADEATAMLETWRRAYFQSPGLRLFFLVPQAWTDAVLPLKISRPAQVRRVMMGRIELISVEQRQLLKKLSMIQVSDASWIEKIQNSANAMRFLQGRSDFGDLGVRIPDDYQTYLDLGRFRNALVLAEQRAHQTPRLNEFINMYGLWAYQVE
jgi:hypothetical protein